MTTAQDRHPQPITAQPDTVAAWWGNLVARQGDVAALRTGDDVDQSLLSLDHRATALAGALLAAGQGKGSRIGLLLGNGPEWIVTWLATQRIGALAVLLSTFFAQEELRHALVHADVGLLITDPAYLGHDYLTRLEGACPGLADADGARPLWLETMPYLRAVWTTAPCDRNWVATTLADAEARGARLVASKPPLVPTVEAQVVPDDPAVIIYTSGSTALPKAVVHSQQTLADKVRFASANNAIIPAFTEPGDVVLITSPLFWVGGFLSCFGALDRGALVSFAPSLASADLWSIIVRRRITHVTGGDSVLRSLQDHLGPDQCLAHRLRPQNSNQFAWFREQEGLDANSIGMAFGMTETMGPHSGFRSQAETFGALRGTAGPALDGIERRIVDPATGAELSVGEVGELTVRGRWLMMGYYKQPAGVAFDAEGFFHTGDRAAIDADGLLYFFGRLSGMIKTSGANVSPEEVEAALRARDDVVEVAVMGLPDAERGEIVVAVVAPQAGASCDAAELSTWLRGRLSSFKVPRRFVFMDYESMPRTSSNKIHKGELSRMIA